MEELFKSEEFIRLLKFMQMFCKSLGSKMASANYYIDRDGYVNELSSVTFGGSYHKNPEPIVKLFNMIYEKLEEMGYNDNFVDEDEISGNEINITFEFLDNIELEIIDYVTRESVEYSDYSLLVEDKELISFLSQLNESGINEFDVDFNGGGDSGYIESRGYTPDMEWVTKPEGLDDIMYEMLNEAQSGWEINEGSQGTFKIDCEKHIIHLNFGLNTENTDSEVVLRKDFKSFFSK